MRLPLAAIIIVIALSLAIDLYIWLDIRQSKSRRRWKWCDRYAIVSLLLWIFLGVTLCMPRRGLDGGVYAVMWMLTAYLSVYMSKFIYCLLSLLGRIPTLLKGKRWIWTKYAGIAAGVLAFAAVWTGVCYTRSHIQTVRVTLDSSRLPESFDGYKIVQISDLHLGTWGDDTSFVEQLADSINAQEPDLIVFTGDIVNQKSDEMIPFIEVLSRLKAKDGVYSILGNHDYGDYVDWPSAARKKKNLDDLKRYQADAGWKMLNNGSTFITRDITAPGDSIQRVDSIALIGVENWGEPPFGQYGDLDAAYPKTTTSHLNDRKFKILLTHNPEHWIREVRNRSNIDLSLSGHTHAMQMSVNGFGKRWSPSSMRYPTWGGFYTEGADDRIEDFGNPDTNDMARSLNKSSLYVNIGSGEVGIPFRLASAYPEITIITLKKK